MTIQALVAGTISAPPVARSTAAGKPFATIALRTQTGESSTFVNVAVFDPDLVELALSLSEGDAVSVTGRLELRTWRGRDGQERTNLAVTATRVLRLEPPEPRKRAPKRRGTPGGDAGNEPFGPAAGDLDSVLPRA